VVGHTGNPLDHLSHALQRPQIVGVAVGRGTFSQFTFHLGNASTWIEYLTLGKWNDRWVIFDSFWTKRTSE
jgi:hypothetical protein